MLKQYKSTGYMKVSMERFREELCIPSTYRMSNINKRVLTPVLKELKNDFLSLVVKFSIKTDAQKIEFIEFNFLLQKNLKSVPKIKDEPK